MEKLQRFQSLDDQIKEWMDHSYPLFEVDSGNKRYGIRGIYSLQMYDVWRVADLVAEARALVRELKPMLPHLREEQLPYIVGLTPVKIVVSQYQAFAVRKLSRDDTHVFNLNADEEDRFRLALEAVEVRSIRSEGAAGVKFKVKVDDLLINHPEVLFLRSRRESGSRFDALVHQTTGEIIRASLNLLVPGFPEILEPKPRKGRPKTENVNTLKIGTFDTGLIML